MESKIQFTRRNLFKTTLAAGLTSAAPVLTSVAQAAETEKKIRPLTGKMTYEEVRNRAREMMMPRCYVCPECNGRGPCIGQVPGFGGMGANRGFQANYDSLAAVQLNSRVVHGVHVPDTSIDFFGTKISMPVVAAPTGGTTYNMGGKLTEEEFVTAICEGCSKAGTLGAVADGIGDPLPVFEKRLDTLKRLGYKAIVGLKPRLNKDIIERMRLAEKAGVVALTIDLDSAGRAARATKGQTVEPKTLEQLKELVKASRLPLLFKGIMTPDEAELCIQAGAAGIVVSNHGGRVLDQCPATAEVLPEIAEALKGSGVKILVDGGIRSGVDVFKALALGADAVLICRPFVTAVYGGGEEGVKCYIDKIAAELADTMQMCGAHSLAEITQDMVRV